MQDQDGQNNNMVHIFKCVMMFLKCNICDYKYDFKMTAKQTIVRAYISEGGKTGFFESNRVELG